jgi:glycosyltransferase involved in cell wall biosynthesis
MADDTGAECLRPVDAPPDRSAPEAAPRPVVSVILATVGSDQRLPQLLSSLRAQTFRRFEVIVVDQSNDDRLETLLESYRDAFPIRHVRHLRGLSRSRNAGLRLARGDIVCFPDDDCRYDADALERACRFLAASPHVDGLAGRALCDRREHPAARFSRSAQWVGARTAWTQGISCTIFLRRALVAQVGPFDETLGLGSGTPWIAAEESDYLIRAVGGGARIWYDPDFTVHHPGQRGRFGAAQRERGYRYARAMGHVLRLHRAGIVLAAYHLARPLAGTALCALQGRLDIARYHLSVFRGRWRGWRETEPAGPGVRAKLEPTPVWIGEEERA